MYKKSILSLITVFTLMSAPMASANVAPTENDINDATPIKIAAASYANSPIPRLPNANPSAFSKPDLTRTQKVNPYKDANEKLYTTIGKSQLIKFDEPVKRISIADPEIAEIVLLSPKELLLNGKKAGRTSLIFWGSNEKPVFFNVVVQQDSDAFIQAIEQVAPNEDVDFVFTDDGVIMSGKVSTTTVKKQIEDIGKAYGFKIVDLTESPTKQVLLEVKITEASRNFTRTLSSQFNLGENYAGFLSDILGIEDITNIKNVAYNTGNAQFLYASDSSKIAWAINAGEQKGAIKILAEPKLLAVNGQPGSFNVGNEIPVPSQMGNYGNVSYTFKNTGVILNFTPTILEKSNRVMLKLAPEISEIDSTYTSSTGVPGFKTRKVETTVELNDGETLIIAGLLNHSSSKSISQIPWIGDIPIIGFFFSSHINERKDTELVIFITPKIIDPSESAMEFGL